MEQIFLTVLIIKTNYSFSVREIRVPLRPFRILVKRGAAKRIEEIKNNSLIFAALRSSVRGSIRINLL